MFSTGLTCLIRFVTTRACRFSICRQIRPPLKLQHSTCFGPARLPVAWRRIAGRLPELTPPTVQYIRADFHPRATSASDTPASNRRTAASLNSLVNCLRDNPMTQFSIHWILSLNRLSQKWGQVQAAILLLAPSVSTVASGRRYEALTLTFDRRP